MKLPVLILGYERSGTTLLRRLVSMHPNMPFDIVHEQSRKLFNSSSKEEVIKKLTFKSKQKGIYTGGISSIKAGQKIPYTNFKVAKKSISKFDSIFNNFFIIHIIRDPVGAIGSQVRTFNRDVNKCISQYFSSVPMVNKYLEDFKNVLTINFEELLRYPFEQVKLIYTWLGSFNEDDTFINLVISTIEPWNYNGRVMPGLRYFDNISETKSNFVLEKKYIEKINRLK